MHRCFDIKDVQKLISSIARRPVLWLQMCSICFVLLHIMQATSCGKHYDPVPAGQLALSKRTWLLATFQVGDYFCMHVTADALPVTQIAEVGT